MIADQEHEVCNRDNALSPPAYEIESIHSRPVFSVIVAASFVLFAFIGVEMSIVRSCLQLAWFLFGLVRLARVGVVTT